MNEWIEFMQTKKKYQKNKMNPLSIHIFLDCIFKNEILFQTKKDK